MAINLSCHQIKNLDLTKSAYHCCFKLPRLLSTVIHVIEDQAVMGSNIDFGLVTLECWI